MNNKSWLLCWLNSENNLVGYSVLASALVATEKSHLTSCFNTSETVCVS